MRQASKHKYVGCTVSFIFVIVPVWLSFLHGKRNSCLFDKLHRLFIHADNREILVIGLFIDIKDIFHIGNKISASGRNYPTFLEMRLKFVFFSSF